MESEKSEKLICIGQLMSNILYNLSQHTSRLDQNTKDHMKELVDMWDNMKKL